MTDQYPRKASLIIGENAGDALDLSELRFSFVVKRGDFQTPNSARIRVYNMNPDTMARVQKEFTRVVLQAGYEGNFGLIFDGTVVQTRRGRTSQVDTHLDITAADGDAAYNFAYVSTTLAAGSTAQDHFNVAAQAMAKHGVGVGYTAGLQSNPLPRGKVMFGMARDFMRGVARATQTTWSIQDGKIVVVPETSYMPGEIPVINSDTGLIGLPVQTQNGINFRVLLNPNIKIGTLVQLDNKAVQQFEYSLSVQQQAQNQRTALESKLQTDGFYYVMWAEHQGDTRGNNWYTDVVCLAADVTSIPESFIQKKEVPSADVIRPFS
ncbi:phage protein [Pandoraea pnomenusa]|uniref:phage protein n=1 Tax=Pandoraea pnomenusa TaxID=93220 RepID=UPI003CEC49E4